MTVQNSVQADEEIRTVVFKGETTAKLPLRDTPEGGKAFRFSAASGLYQFALVLDAARFDWESLYQVLDMFHNEKERTGPWDFEIKTAKPLIPAYWVALDGRKLGLWYMQRISLADLADKRFRGRFAMAIDKPGEHEITLTPYRPHPVAWMDASLETDPEDRLASGLIPAFPVSCLPTAAWNDPIFWQGRQKLLETSHQVYQPPLKALWTRLAKGVGGGINVLPMLVAGYHMGGMSNALQSIERMVDDHIARPAWGRPQEDAYGYNGDIGGADSLRCMAWAYHMLGPRLAPEKRERLLVKLVRQGNAFMEQMLLMRDYWGGSVLQDHGWRAGFDFGTAALHLWGVVPDADRWVAYIVPRMQRALDAMPTDGVIPGSSYYAVQLYLHNLMWYRDALLARTGRDILEHPSLRRIPAFVNAVMDRRSPAMLVADNSDRIPLRGGLDFFGRLAVKFQDPDAAHIHRAILATPAAELDSGDTFAAASGILWGFMAYDPAIETIPGPEQPRRNLLWFKDSGFVHYRNDDEGVVLALRCGPWLGYNAQRRATGPCDMMECQPAAGHFTILLDGKPVLVTPGGGYSLRSALRTCMLIDGKGQIGDVGYPMSIPSQPHRGETVESVRWDSTNGAGLVRLDLTRAYSPEAGVKQYFREFMISTNRSIVCRDRVELVRPAILAWLFQAQKETGIRIENGAARIGDSPGLRIVPRPAAPVALAARVEPTKVVYSYSMAFSPVEHVRFETAQAVKSVAMDFELRW